MSANAHIVLRSLGVALMFTIAACAQGASTFDDTVNGNIGGAPGAKGPCGNGVVDMGEDCDPKAALTASCQSLGGAGGMLFCDPTTCHFNTMMCKAASGTSGSGGAGS